MHYYCTYFDRHYLLRGLALYQSLQRHAAPFRLWVLCFDEWSYDLLTRLGEPDLIPIALREFEKDDTALRAVKPTRSRVEYYFTCSPSWPLFLLDRYPEIDILTYLDADLYFFASPEPVFDEMGNASVMIVGHRFPEHLRHLELHGIYNVGLLSFRNDDAGRECLHWWRERCLEWCGIEPEDGKFADQQYLDDWPQRFPQTHVLQHEGAGLAPWNGTRYAIRDTADGITVNGRPLIFYHYHGLKFFTRWLYDPVLLGPGYGYMPRATVRLLYGPYVRALKETAQWLRTIEPSIAIEQTRIGDYGWRMFLSKVRRGRLLLGLNLR